MLMLCFNYGIFLKPIDGVLTPNVDGETNDFFVFHPPKKILNHLNPLININYGF